MKKLPVGTPVIVSCPIEELSPSGEWEEVHPKGSVAVVVRHGYDSGGIYTEVEFSDGSRYGVHRDNLVRGRK